MMSSFYGLFEEENQELYENINNYLWTSFINGLLFSFVEEVEKKSKDSAQRRTFTVNLFSFLHHYYYHHYCYVWELIYFSILLHSFLCAQTHKRKRSLKCGIGIEQPERISFFFTTLIHYGKIVWDHVIKHQS